MALKVEKQVSPSKGLLHLNDKVTFVNGALEGEDVELLNIKEKKNYIEADAFIVSPSPNRTEPICPYYYQCGGCSCQILSEKNQAIIKEKEVKVDLSRSGISLEDTVFDSLVFGPFLNYRSRARFHVDLKTREKGFLKKGSNILIPVKSCPALDKSLNQLLQKDDQRLLDKARELMLTNAVNGKTHLVEVNAITNGYDVTLGPKIIRIKVGEYEYSVNANVFFQSNLYLLPQLLEYVKENAEGNTIMDLYSGVGTFSALFENKNVFAVELERECLKLSKINAPWASSFSDDVAKWFKKVKVIPDTIIVDPPRVGLSKEAVRMLPAFDARRIIYVSCNPKTAQRDIKELKGYKLMRVKVFDFYPSTDHSECVFILDRR